VRTGPTLFFLLSVAVFCGCNSSKHTTDSVSLAELTPAENLPQTAILDLADTEIPVAVECNKIGSKFEIQLLAYNELIESETYDIRPSAFSLVECLGETYSPAIPLLQTENSPMRPWNWKGTILSGGISRNASAEMRMQSAQVPVGATGSAAWKVSAMLSLDGGAQHTAKRVLTFTFVPKQGLVERAFGMGSERRLKPAPPGSK